jgi:peptide/nickel transport system permease protein
MSNDAVVRRGGAPTTWLRAPLAKLRKDQREALRSPLLIAGAVLVGAFVFVAVFAPLLAPYDPHALTGDSLGHPSASHLLGTNDIGQDILSEVIWGARYSLTVAVAAATLAVVAGVLVGVLSGLVGGLVDVVVMRVVDVFLALPGLPLAILITALAGPKRSVIIVVIAFAGWSRVARSVRSQSLSLRERGFVAAARGYGAGPLYIVRRHLVPALGPIIVALWIDWAASAVFVESGLALLGLGDPLHVSWGTILDRAFRHQGLYFGNLWAWWVLPAGLAITFAVIGFTLLGVGLEPVFNPRWARK